ncbi:MAG: dihydroxy-acid dehydratase [Lutisporaceae bacterium]
MRWELTPDLIMQEFDRQSTQFPYCPYKSRFHIYDMEDFYKSGGVPRVMEYLKDHINLDVMTVTGKTLGENINQHSYLYSDCNDEVIRPFDRPFDTLGGLAIMRGNLAPDTA